MPRTMHHFLPGHMAPQDSFKPFNRYAPFIMGPVSCSRSEIVSTAILRLGFKMLLRIGAAFKSFQELGERSDFHISTIF